MPKRRVKESISSILLGDSLGELVALLGAEGNEGKLIVILVHPGGVSLAAGKGFSKAELLGALYLATDQITYSEGYYE